MTEEKRSCPVPLEYLIPRCQNSGLQGQAQHRLLEMGQAVSSMDGSKLQGPLVIQNPFNVLAEPESSPSYIAVQTVGGDATEEVHSLQPGWRGQEEAPTYCPSVARGVERVIRGCTKLGGEHTMSSPDQSIERPLQTNRKGNRGAGQDRGSSSEGCAVAEVILLDDSESKSLRLEPVEVSGEIGVQTLHQGNINSNVSSPCIFPEYQGTTLGIGANVAETMSNWDKLGGEDTDGLLLSLLKMKRDDLDVVATLLDAKTMGMETVARNLASEKVVTCFSTDIKGGRMKGPRQAEGVEGLPVRIAPKSDAESALQVIPKVTVDPTFKQISSLSFQTFPVLFRLFQALRWSLVTAIEMSLVPMVAEQ